MATCAGTTKAGKACNHKAFAGSSYCKIHDEHYKAMRKNQILELQEKSSKALEYIAQRVGTQLLKEGEKEEQIAKSLKHHTEEQIRGYVNTNIVPVIRKLAVTGSDLLGYPKDQALFPRKIWMMISWNLDRDHQTYFNLAMSCKALYKVLVEDKVCHYVHPLKSVFKTPLLFIKPVYRILSLEVPEEFDNLMTAVKLPTVPEMLGAYADAYGLPGSELEEIQRRAEVTIDLIKRMVKASLKTEDEFEETIEGAGIFDYFHEEAKFSLRNFPHSYMLYQQGRSTYLIVDSCRGKELDHLLSRHLVSFDGRFLIQLMRV